MRKRSTISRSLGPVVAVFLYGWLGVAPSEAHELRPAYLELKETAPGEFDALWKTPARGEMRLSLAPEFSGAVELLSPPVTRMTGEASIETWKLRASALRGAELRIAGLEGTMTDALVRVEFADGSSWVHRLTPSQPSAVIPSRQTSAGVALQYGKLGTEHILTGFDHLLFVLALMFMVPSGWKLVKTITAFTLSHTVTLTLATLGVVNLPPRPVEALIALSIAIAAVEIVHRQQGREGLVGRAPWLLSFGFGLLHGLGFAGGLAEAGLPAGHIPEALLFFSAGVEAGHLIFIGVTLTPLVLVRMISQSLPTWTERIPPYAIGSVAMFWLIQRITLF